MLARDGGRLISVSSIRARSFRRDSPSVRYTSTVRPMLVRNLLTLISGSLAVPCVAISRAARQRGFVHGTRAGSASTWW